MAFLTDDNDQAPSEGQTAAEECSDALSAISMIEESLAETQSDTNDRGAVLRFPLRMALELLPESDRGTLVDPSLCDGEFVDIEVKDLYEQLARGKVSIPASEIAYFIPAHLLSHEAAADRHTEITLPLKDVFEAVGLDELQKHMPRQTRHYDLDNISDPFSGDFQDPARSSATPTPASGMPGSVPAEAPEPIEQPASEEEKDYRELPGNINVNTATREELVTLTGVSGPLADRILQYRNKKGSFKSIFDLYGVPRLGRKTFRRMTGMPHSPRHLHRGRRLAKLLKLPIGEVSNLQVLAGALARMPGFSGCVISDGEGLLLAQGSADDLGTQLSAVVPRTIRQIRESMNAIKAGRVDSISICTCGRMYTIVGSRHMALTAIHEENRVTKTQLSLIRKVGNELAWLLSHRAYVEIE